MTTVKPPCNHLDACVQAFEKHCTDASRVRPARANGGQGGPTGHTAWRWISQCPGGEHAEAGLAFVQTIRRRREQQKVSNQAA